MYIPWSNLIYIGETPLRVRHCYLYVPLSYIRATRALQRPTFKSSTAGSFRLLQGRPLVRPNRENIDAWVVDTRGARFFPTDDDVI